MDDRQTLHPAADKWLDADIQTLQQGMQDGELTAHALTSLYLERIDLYNQKGPALNVVQTTNPSALAEAAALDAERSVHGPRSPLHGIPVLVKDNYESKGMPTSAGSILFAGHSPDRDATLVSRLKDAGAVILGKATMHEFAYGISTVGSLFGASKNPFALNRNPGGSSGGSAAAVAAKLATFAMGSDTCGSIRIPAAHNQLVGLRGTQGLSSRHGIVPLSSTQDIGGPLTRTVRDLAMVLDATAGYDVNDAQTAESLGQLPDSYVATLRPLQGIRVGLLTDWLVQDSEDTAVAQVVLEALGKMQAQTKWQVLEFASTEVNTALNRPLNGHFVLIHDFKTDINAYLQANPSLGYTAIEDLLADGRAHPNIVPSLQASVAMDASDYPLYLAELAQRRVVRRALLAMMAQHNLDALAYPTIRRIAAPIGEEQMGTNCRLAANSGLPAISVPVGFVDGVPVGLEFLAERWSEPKLLSIALTVEQTLSQRRSPKATP